MTVKKKRSEIYHLRLPDDYKDEPSATLPFRAIWVGFKDFTSAHGVPHMTTATGPLKKTLWTLATLGCLALLAYNMYYLVNDYLQYPVNVSVEIKSKNKLDFPAVTICNVNPVRNDLMMGNPALREVLGVSDVDEATDSTLIENTAGRTNTLVGRFTRQSDSATQSQIIPDPIIEEGTGPPRAKRQAPLENTINSDTNQDGGGGNSGGGGARQGQRVGFQLMEQIRQLLSDMDYSTKSQLGHQLEDMILDCSFAGYDCNLTRDFTHTYNSVYGNCFVFHWGLTPEDRGRFQSKRPGPMNGLELIVHIDQFEYIGDLADTAGVRVLIDSQTMMPFPEDLGISASPGQETSIGIHMVNITRKGYPYGSCVSIDQDDRDRNVFQEAVGTMYSNKACERTCYQKYLIENCSCADAQYPRWGIAFGYANVSACASSDTCQVLVEKMFANDELQCDCPMPCQQLTLSPTVSTVIWPSIKYTDALKSMVGDAAQGGNQRAVHLMRSGFDQHYAENLAKIVIYFNEFNYEEIYETPVYTFGGFVSGLGGILGLYIGFSILTILEFVELALDTMVLACAKCCSKGRSKTQPLP